LAVVVAIILCIIQLKETQLSFSISHLKSIIAYARPILSVKPLFLPCQVWTGICSPIILALETAAYAIAIKFALVPTLLIRPFTLWWFPKCFRLLKS